MSLYKIIRAEMGHLHTDTEISAVGRCPKCGIDVLVDDDGFSTCENCGCESVVFKVKTVVASVVLKPFEETLTEAESCQ